MSHSSSGAVAPFLSRAYAVLPSLSKRYPTLEGMSPCATHPFATQHDSSLRIPRLSSDLHVLGTPPAFVLSQDRTLRPNLTLIAARFSMNYVNQNLKRTLYSGSYLKGILPSVKMRTEEYVTKWRLTNNVSNVKYALNLFLFLAFFVRWRFSYLLFHVEFYLIVWHESFEPCKSKSAFLRCFKVFHVIFEVF